jgi:hypothetical protein
MWMETGTEFPAFLARIRGDERKRREEELERILRKLPASAESGEARDAVERAAFRARVRAAVLKSLLPARSGEADEFLRECECVSEDFVRGARAFDPSVTEEEIRQALRNQWVFNSIQKYLGRPASLTNSSLAYSLLYPYTDNTLDGGVDAGRDTTSFLQWISDRLEGGNPYTADERLAKLDRLIGMIEAEFPRERFTEVHGGLLAIHAAQRQSVLLHGNVGSRTAEELLEVTVEKGGTSVLADALLVSGHLGPEVAEAMFGYGVLLQLVDDLQDVDEDAAEGHSSPFTRVGIRLEDETNRLLNFARRCVSLMDARSSSGGEFLCGLIGQSCNALILEAVARHRASYGSPYLHRVEELMPLRLDYLGGLKQRMKRKLSPDGTSVLRDS